MNNVLRGTKTYLIGTMQYANGRDWRNYVKEELKDRGITIFDPYHKPFLDGIEEDEAARLELGKLMDESNFDEVAKRMRRVRALDLRLCDISDYVIAHILPSVASWGSAEELVTCCRMKKVLFLSIEGSKNQCPLWLMGMFPHKYIFNNVEESVRMIKDIDDGKVDIDSDRWKLLKPEFR